MSFNSSFDVLTATAASLQEQLSNGTITSVQIVETYLAQIEKHNHAGMKLNVLISVAPAKDVIARAGVLDDERRQGKIRGPLHGLPIIVKDCIMTAPELGMDTTVGAYVFAGLKSKKNAAVLDQCIESGMIILGKATLTEFCGHRGTNVRPGYSAYGGQTLSAYDSRKPGPPGKDETSLIRDTACGGSSSGSAVGVSAGFSPLSLGTDTSGSVVFPAGKNGVYAIKPSKGLIASSGCFRISSSYDGIGAMAKTPADLAMLVESILLPESRGKLPADGYQSIMTKTWEGAKIGIIDLNWGGTDMGKWGSDGIKSKFEGVVERIRAFGGHAVYPVTPPNPESCKYKNVGLYHIACYEFNTVVKTFCNEFEDARVHSLSDIIKYNKNNAAIAMPDPFPDQKPLIDSLNSPLTDEESQVAYAEVKKIAGEEGLGKLMEENNVDILVSHSDCTLISFANAAGWPSATVPLGIYEKNGQPYGLFVVARENREDVLFKFMSAFEATFPKIPNPKM